MNIEDLISAIDAHKELTGDSDSALALKAGMSKDAIRNWRRAIRDQKEVSLNAKS